MALVSTRKACLLQLTFLKSPIGRRCSAMWSMKCTTTVMSSWKLLRCPEGIRSISLYCTSFFWAARWSAARMRCRAMSCNPAKEKESGVCRDEGTASNPRRALTSSERIARCEWFDASRLQRDKLEGSLCSLRVPLRPDEARFTGLQFNRQADVGMCRDA